MPLSRLAPSVGVDLSPITNVLAGLGQDRRDRKLENENVELTTKAAGGDKESFARLFARNPQSAALLEDIVHNRKLDQAAQVSAKAEAASRDAAFLRSISDDGQQVQQLQRMARDAAVAGDTGRAQELLTLSQAPYDDRNLELLQDVVDSKDALSILQHLQPKAAKPVALSQGQQLVDPATGRAIAENVDEGEILDREKFEAEQLKKQNPTSIEVFDEAQKLRKEYTSVSKTFADQNEAFQRLQSAGSEPSAAGDLALIFGYMRLLDPASTVREGEFATAAKAGGVDDRVRGLYNSIRDGERLSESQRADFLDRAGRLFESASRINDNRVKEFTRLSNEFGIDPSLVIFDRNTADKPQRKPLSKVELEAEARRRGLL